MGLTTDDQVAIQGLAARYNHAIDSGDADAFLATFVETGVLDAGVGLSIEGHAALKDFATNFASSARAPRHVATNLVIDGDGDQATLKAYVQMYIMSGDPAQQVIAAAGKYDDTLVKEAGTWKFVRRNFTADS
jgi:ketosteroid isomerase-like protein